MIDNHWHILGAGAIGCLWASWLNDRCTLLLKESFKGKADCNKSFDFIVEKSDTYEKHSIPFVHATETAPIKQLLICTKAHHTHAAIQNIKLKPKAVIVLMQNGMGNLELLETQFPDAFIFMASTSHGAYRKHKQHIVHAGDGQTILGSTQIKKSQANRPTDHDIAHSLSNPHESVMTDQDIEKRLWIKLAINCAINPLTALHQCKNGELVQDRQKLEQLQKVCLEVDKLLHKKNILESTQSCFDIVTQVAKDTAENYSSMHQDIQKKQHSEIDFIQGFLLKHAQSFHIDMPENKSLYNAIKGIEKNF